MRYDDDKPLPLAALRTPPPLREADYAAVRARVLFEIAKRAERRGFWMFFRFAAIAAAVAAVVFLSIPRQPAVVPNLPPPPREVARRSTEPPNQQPTTNNQQPVVVIHHEQIAKVRKPHRASPEEPMRIQIHTADPDIRIIWIVTPTT